MEYRGPENKTIYILLPDGFTHRVRVWWKDTPKTLNEKFIQRFGERCYKLELWQTKVVNAETRQEADMLLNEHCKGYNTRVGDLEKEDMWLKLSDWMNESEHPLDYKTRADELREMEREQELSFDSDEEWAETEII